jgi:hypothetical protein
MKVFSAINAAAGQKMILDAINTQNPDRSPSPLRSAELGDQSQRAETSTFVTQGQVVMNLGAPIEASAEPRIRLDAAIYMMVQLLNKLVVNSKTLNGLMRADAELQNEAPSARAVTPVGRRGSLTALDLN